MGTKRKILSILMAVCLIVGILPVSALAQSANSSSSQIGNYYQVNDTNGTLPSNPTLSSGQTQQSYEDGKVKVNKTISGTEEENVFDVNLEVVTTEEFDQIELTEDAAVVLVIDTSSSMDNGDRIGSAKRAAQAFINSFASSDANVNRKIAIVRFSGYKGFNVDGATTVLNWEDASDNTTQSSWWQIDEIRSLRANGGTNIEAGLILAQNLLTDDAVKDIANKNIILLSDGKPTYGVSGNERNSTSKTVICGNSTDNNTIGDGSSTTHTIHTQVEEQVNRIIHNGITPYAVFVGSDTINCRERDCSLNTQWGTSCSKWLADIGFTTFSAKESGDLEEIFENISHLIQIQARAWILTDPMGDNIDFIQFNRATNMEDEFLEENGVVSWYLRKAEPVKTVDGNTTTYTYTLSYRIRLDNLADGVQAEQYYPTNGVTSLTYLITTIRDGEESYKDGTAYFNIPSVKGFEGEEITLNKVGSFGEAMSGVTFTLTTADDPSFSKTFTTDANGALKLSGIPSGHTYTLTETVPNGYEAADPITVTVAWGKTAVSGVSNNTIVNQSKTTSITVTKAWDDGDDQDGIRPGSVEVQLYADGTACGDPVTVTEANNWQYTWEDLPEYKDGKAVVYTVKETTEINGYTSNVDGFTITNTHVPETTSVTVTKVWEDGDNQDGIRPESVEVQLYANGEAYGDPVEVTADNGWQYTWMNLPENANGEAIVYTVAEINVPEGYEAQVDGLTITNTHTPGTTEFTVTKEWVDGNDQDGSRPDHVTVQLYAGEKAVGSPVEITAEMDWTYTWTDLDVNAAGQKIEYTVKELNVPEGYEVSYAPAESGNADYIVTNTHIPTISIPITKTVEQKGSEAPAKEIFEFIISELNSDAEYTIENASIETDGAGTYTGTLTITVPDAEAFAKLSEGFTVTEKNSGEENWSYDTTEWFVWMTMNEDGSISIHTANLTAGEKPWDNAASASSALTFTNTYNKTQTPVIPEAPDTGDSNGVGWMAILFATSAVCLGAVALYNKKRIHRN